MKSALITGLVALASTAFASQYTNQSDPFYLTVKSRNATLNGSTLEACHEGAALEGLCLGASRTTSRIFTYNFNTSDNALPANASLGVQGILTYVLQGSNFNESEPLELSINPVSNVAVPLFTPSETGTTVAFDAHERLNIQGYVDDRTDPASYHTQAFYRWYVCTTTTSYTYQTLSWVLGTGKPENPTCVKVEVVRVFV
ncbi:MAG: hypothetical protein M1818_008222 [Claussenomyces sp. TS43310]|nr:MAG: hypothetical protein M1818_008222 [Claussenomyces sp. TS43310]